VRMAQILRQDRGSKGLVTSNGGYLSKHAFGVYSTTPPADGFQYDSPQAKVDALPQREAVLEWDGPVTVEAYTVAYAGGEPAVGYVSCLTPDGRRSWARVDKSELLDVMTREELCRRNGRIDGKGGLEIL